MKKLIFCFLLFLASNVVFGQEATQPVGNGTEESPYQIASLPNLYWISQQTLSGNSFTGKYLKQTDDINASSTSAWFDGEGWLPIGNYYKPFSGNYNGDGHTIDGLCINRPDESYIGFFGYVTNATISNLGVTNINFHGNNYTGGIVGNHGASVTTNCFSTGEIEGQSAVGGLIGAGDDYDLLGILRNSYSSVNVSGGTLIGGLIGANQAKVISCYSTGDVNGNMYVGGLAGYNGDYAEISNCYSSSNVTGNSDVGGLVGRNYYIVTIENSYSIGFVSGEINTGGLIGYSFIMSGGVNNCFWNIESSGQQLSAGGSGKSTLEMIHYAIYGNWDFSSVWKIIYGESYPFFLWQDEPNNSNFPSLHAAPSKLIAALDGSSVKLSWSSPSVGSPSQYKIFRDEEFIAVVSDLLSYNDYNVDNYTSYKYQVTSDYDGAESCQSNTASIYFFPGFDGGNGSTIDPFLVSNDGQLNAIRYRPSSHYLQTANIDLSDSQWNQDNGWIPIGDNTNRFRGTFNGNNHSINGLYINRPVSDMQGLFGYTYLSTISNVTLTNVNVTGNELVGGLVGYHRNSTMSNCNISGNISGGMEIGGLIGENYSSAVINCQNNATVHGSWEKIGGIVGFNRVEYPGDPPKILNKEEYNFYSRISNSRNSGNITGGSSVGGIAGENDYYSYIGACFNEGNISGSEYVGGITSSNDMGVLMNCYNTGSVSGAFYVGGIVGWNDDIPEYSVGYVPNLTNSYNIASVTGGGLVGNSVSTNLVTKSYWNAVTSGTGYSSGGESRTTEEMTYPYATNTYVEWDFSNVWAEDVEGINDGYPQLKPVYTLIIRVNRGGIVKVNNQQYYSVMTIKPNTEISLKALANTNWNFAGWSGDLISTNSEETIVIDNNKIITANFEAIPATSNSLNVLAYPENGGTVSGGGIYEIGETLTINATPNTADNFEFAGWYFLSELQSENEEYSFSMPNENLILVGKFVSGVSVQQNNGIKVSLFPNPFNKTITISTTETIKQIQFFDTMGQTKMQINNPQSQINTTDLNSGIYFIKITDNEDHVKVLKMIKL